MRMMMTGGNFKEVILSTINPKRGKIWIVNLEPTKGAEIQKTRPVVVVGSDGLGKLPLRLIAPITGWKSEFESNIWHIKIEPNSMNHLNKISAVDVLQLRGIDIQRFVSRMGITSAQKMEEIATAISAVVEYV